MNSLGEIFANILVPLFPKLDPHLHPWWWPRESGRGLEDWGLNDELVRAQGCDSQVLLRSLQRGPYDRKPAGREYPGFLGGVGAQARPDLVWILSSRPSSDTFPNGGGTTTRLYNLLKRTGLINRAHVTDLVKFHGPGPDRLAHSQLGFKIQVGRNPMSLLDISMECLMAEFDLVPPAVVLTSGRAKRWLMEFAKERRGYDIKALLSDLLARSQWVTSWMAMKKQGEIAHEWILKTMESRRPTHPAA